MPGEVLLGMAQVEDAIYDDAVRGTRLLSVFPDLPAGPHPNLQQGRLRVRDYDDDLQRLGVRTYAIVTRHRSSDRGLMAYLNSDRLAAVRVVRSVPTRFVIVDDRVAFVALTRRRYLAGAVRVTEPGLVAALLGAWSHLCHEAVDLDPSPPRTALTALDREVLTQLEQGATDAAIARRLHVSERTVARMIASLMHRLNSQSRFGLGAAAARLGVL